MRVLSVFLTNITSCIPDSFRVSLLFFISSMCGRCWSTSSWFPSAFPRVSRNSHSGTASTKFCGLPAAKGARIRSHQVVMFVRREFRERNLFRGAFPWLETSLEKVVLITHQLHTSGLLERVQFQAWSWKIEVVLLVWTILFHSRHLKTRWYDWFSTSQSKHIGGICPDKLLCSIEADNVSPAPEYN